MNGLLPSERQMSEIQAKNPIHTADITLQRSVLYFWFVVNWVWKNVVNKK